MIKKYHWLYGLGKDKLVEFNVDVVKETDCRECIHVEMCELKMEKFCGNYKFGTSEFKDCQSCFHKFTRYDKSSIPCFKCKYFIKDEKTK